jgi:hypothetical protein
MIFDEWGSSPAVGAGRSVHPRFGMVFMVVEVPRKKQCRRRGSLFTDRERFFRRVNVYSQV